jgi:hypothetical protein
MGYIIKVRRMGGLCLALAARPESPGAPGVMNPLRRADVAKGSLDPLVRFPVDRLFTTAWTRRVRPLTYGLELTASRGLPNRPFGGDPERGSHGQGRGMVQQRVTLRGAV